MSRFKDRGWKTNRLYRKQVQMPVATQTSSGHVENKKFPPHSDEGVWSTQKFKSVKMIQVEFHPVIVGPQRFWFSVWSLADNRFQLLVIVRKQSGLITALHSCTPQHPLADNELALLERNCAQNKRWLDHYNREQVCENKLEYGCKIKDISITASSLGSL